MEPILRFSDEQYRAALDSWVWLDLAGKTPRFASPFGDLFLESADGWWFLDTVEGTLTRVWNTGEELQETLNTPEGQDQYLMVGLARAAEAVGTTVGDGEVYSLTTPPVLGGALEPENVAVADFVVSLDIAGQIHDRVRNLPPGTTISGFSLS